MSGVTKTINNNRLLVIHREIDSELIKHYDLINKGWNKQG